jgi:transcriptional antiterminator RfaH
LDTGLNSKKWYVLYVNVRHERKVFEKLLKQEIESYLPMVKNIKQWSDRKKTVCEPLITGYVFVKLEEHELDKPRYVPGVLNYLSFGKQKAILQQSEIDSLKYLVENGYLINLDSSGIHVGAKVKLSLSAFKDHVAVVQSIEDQNAVVYFESLKQYIKVTTPISVIESVNIR